MFQYLTNSQSMDLKKLCVVMSKNPVSGWHPSLSTGFLLRNPFKMEAALTDNDLGIRMGRSRITEINIMVQYYFKKTQLTKKTS